MTVTGSREALRGVLEFYADPFAWKKKHDPDNLVSVPDFYSETAFGDTAADALAALDPAGATLTFEKIARRDIAEVVERLAYRLTPNMQCALTDAIHSLHRASPDPAGVTLTLEENDLLRRFADQYVSGEQGCWMEHDAAQALATAIRAARLKPDQ